MKLLISAKCSSCGKPMLVSVRSKETVQDREFQVLILQRLAMCKSCAQKLAVKMEEARLHPETEGRIK